MHKSQAIFIFIFAFLGALIVSVSPANDTSTTEGPTTDEPVTSNVTDAPEHNSSSTAATETTPASHSGSTEAPGTTTKAGGSSTTTKAGGSSTTVKPKTSTPSPTKQPPPAPPSASQRFDAASFIGGIVLCGGLIAIIYFGCKFYKARNERNYHQF